MIRLTRPSDRLAQHYDVVVVGSGYGGGVAASRLARVGKRVAVLERGREFVAGEFPTRFSDLRQQLQITGMNRRVGPSTALYDVHLGQDMHVLVGCGLGGGSLINAGVTLRPDPRVMCDDAWPTEIGGDGLMAEGYARSDRWLRPALDPDATRRTKFKAFGAGGAHLGSVVPAPVAVSFAETINPAGIRQAACTGCGDCCGGCNVGAKNTVALTYLPDAVRHGAQLFTHIKVRHVSQGSAGRWQVHFERQDGSPSDAAGSITADIVVLAAGSLGSTEILLRSREYGLAVSERLGERFSANGDIIAFGYGAKIPVNAIGVGHPAKVNGLDIGAAVSGQIEIHDADNLEQGILIQEGVLPSALAPVLPVLFLSNGRLLGALQSVVAGVYQGPFARLQTFFAVSHDSAAGRLALKDDRICLLWPSAKDEPVYDRLDATLSALAQRAGATYIKNPLAGTMVGHQPTTAHPLGGCRMARERGDGVVNHKSQVFDGAARAGAADVHEGLYVVDGSVIPRSLGVNPLFTITALAERALIHMMRDYGLALDDGVPQRERLHAADLPTFA